MQGVHLKGSKRRHIKMVKEMVFVVMDWNSKSIQGLMQRVQGVVIDRNISNLLLHGFLQKLYITVRMLPSMA